MTGILSCSARYTGAVSEHFDGKAFKNLHTNETRGFFDLLKWQFQGGRSAWPKWVDNTTHPTPTAPTASGTVHATFINHASYLLQWHGLAVITDPVFSQRCSPFTWAGPKRVRDPGVPLDKLPPIDVVLVSHNHYDHLDIPSLVNLDSMFHPLFVVGIGNAVILRDAGIKNVVELDLWQKHQVKTRTGQLADITFVPSQHFSARGAFDQNLSLWGGWFVTASGQSAYHSGDTGYNAHFSMIKARLGSPDIALLPIGAYEPRWFMNVAHMNPDDAVKAHVDLGAKTSLAMHFGTFQLTNESIDAPIADLKEALTRHNVPTDQFQVLDFGATVVK